MKESQHVAEATADLHHESSVGERDYSRIEVTLGMAMKSNEIEAGLQPKAFDYKLAKTPPPLPVGKYTFN